MNGVLVVLRQVHENAPVILTPVLTPCYDLPRLREMRYGPVWRQRATFMRLPRYWIKL